MEGEDRLYTEISIPLGIRVAKTALVAAFGGAICCLVWWFQYDSGQLEQSWWFAVPPLIACCVVGFIAFFRKVKRVPTAAGKAEEEKRVLEQRDVAAEAVRREEEFLNRWYVRYCIVCLAGWAAYHFMFEVQKPVLWLAGIFALVAVYKGRELALLLLAIGAIVYLVSGIAALPVSVAVIIGAVIIAYAVRSK